jgi:parallel beta-helix repeat protein
MRSLKAVASPGYLLATLVLGAGYAGAADISGTISSTLTIMENSRLVGDVQCTVNGAPCISFGASGLTLDLNGYTITGLGDPVTGCGGAATANEYGISVNAFNNIVIRGLGLVQQFRNQGIFLASSTGSTVTGVTISTNCASGIIVVGGSDNLLDSNTSVRNGNGGNPCGGI